MILEVDNNTKEVLLSLQNGIKHSIDKGFKPLENIADLQKDVQEKLVGMKNELIDAHDCIDGLNGSVRKLQRQNVELTESIDSFQTKISELKESIDMLQSENVELKSMLNEIIEIVGKNIKITNTILEKQSGYRRIKNGNKRGLL